VQGLEKIGRMPDLKAQGFKVFVQGVQSPGRLDRLLGRILTHSPLGDLFVIVVRPLPRSQASLAVLAVALASCQAVKACARWASSAASRVRCRSYAEP
jgi:hypothetical protein